MRNTMIEVERTFIDDDGTECKQLLVTRDDMDCYCDPDTLDDWEDRVISIDYNDDDTFTVIVTA
jgi:hypothetical protein